MYGCCEDRNLGIALPAVGGIISSIGGLFGSKPTLADVYREDGARWSAKKQYWELPPGTKAAVQSPKPSGPPELCAGMQSCVQSMQGGPVAGAGGAPIITPKNAAPPTASDPVYSGGVQQYPTYNPVTAGSTTPLLIAGAGLLALVMLSKRR